MAQNTPATHLPATEAPPVSGAEVWLEANFKKVLIALLLIVLGLCAYFLVYFRTQAAENEAAEAFTSASTLDELESVASRHAGTAAAANALLAKAGLLWDENKKDQSVAALREFAAAHTDHPLLVPTLLSLGSKLESMEEDKDASEVYQQVVNDHTESPMAPLAEIRLADLLWKEGKTDEAKTIYESIPSKYPGTNQPFFEQSQDRLKWLGANLPTTEVDGPPAPEPPPPATTGTPIPLSPTGGPPLKLGSQGVTITPDGGAITAPITIAPAADMAQPDATPAAAATPDAKPTPPSTPPTPPAAAPAKDAPPAPAPAKVETPAPSPSPEPPPAAKAPAEDAAKAD